MSISSNVTFEVMPEKNGVKNVTITGKQGATWNFNLIIRKNGAPFDLTGYFVRGQIRKFHSSTNVTQALTCSVVSPATDGKTNIKVAASDTAAIPAGKLPTDSASKYVYDIEFYTGTPEVVDRTIQGVFQIDPEVTKA